MVAKDSDKIILKTPEEIEKMRLAGRLAAQTLNLAGSMIRPGLSTLEIDKACVDFIKSHGALSATLHYKGYPKSICTSINDVVCHGIPNAKDILENGDIINVDVTVILDGFYGDTSKTFSVGQIPENAKKLVERTERAMMVGIEAVKPGAYVSDIGNAIESYLRPFRYGIVRALGGHGVGKYFHEAPFVHHHRQSKKGPKLKPGMTFTVEPMINEGRYDVFVDEGDGWTVYSKDGSLSAQFEHTIAVTERGFDILTLP
ncbi:MAG: type I methionyl aminopeptidase [Spirochaetia bacterium]|nr:type I methionyl aminopeptidase [Spirochaetia bacterium]